MDLPGSLFSSGWLTAAHLCYWPALALAAATAPWRRLRGNEASHVYLGMCVGVLALWQIKAELLFGLSLHLLGATLMTLMFGWQLALIGLAAVLLGSSLAGGPDWPAFGLNALIFTALPVAVSYSVATAVFRRLPRHFFVYIFLSGFANAALTMALAGFAAIGLLVLASDLGLDQLGPHYLIAYVALLFPEAFITGALLTVFVVYCPTWVGSFNDHYYLDK